MPNASYPMRQPLRWLQEPNMQMRKKAGASLRIIAFLGAAPLPAYADAPRGFLLGNRVIRACVDADQALDASVLVDDANVFDLKRILRALAFADAASDAIVRTDFHCHDKPHSLLALRASSTRRGGMTGCIGSAPECTADGPASSRYVLSRA